MKKIKMNRLSKLFKIQFIFLIGVVCSVISLRSQTVKKYDYKNFVVNEERYFAIPFCYLGRHNRNPLVFINYMKLYDKQYMYVPMSTPGYDLKELLNYNEYFELENIWHLDDINNRFRYWPGSDPSEDYKLWMNQFIDFIKSNNTNIVPVTPYIIKIGNTDKHVSLYPPNRIQVPVSKAIQRGIKSYKKDVLIYDYFIIKCKINYIRQDSINIFMPVIAPKRIDIRKNLFFISNYFYIPFNIAGKSRFDQMMTFYRFKDGIYSIESLLNVYKNKRDAYKNYKNAYKSKISGYPNISSKHDFKHQLKHRIKYSYNEIDFHNIRLYFTDQELELLLKAFNSSHKNKVNLYAPQTVKENIIISIREFSIPSEHELLEYISNCK